MTPEAEMKELIERLEATTEGSRELDAAIAVVVRGLVPVGKTANGYEMWDDPTGYRVTAFAASDTPHGIALYTASIDAALTLVPANRPFLVGGNARPAYAQIYSHEPPPAMAIETAAVVGEGRARTPALALCIAALKARSV